MAPDSASACAPAPATSSEYDRLSELKAFDATKAGVKGLVDADISAVPRIFHHAIPAVEPDELSSPHHRQHGVAGSRVPVIDVAAARSDLVAQVKATSETAGFFQVVNHGVPEELLTETLASVRRFHEEPAEAKKPYYTRDRTRRVRYESNFDLFESPAANWRDTLSMLLNPAPPEDVPPACQGMVSEYTPQVQKLASTLMELLSEAMGLPRTYLEKDAGGMDGVVVVGHYYPPCPEPRLTMGTTKHSDPCFLTVLLQDGVGGLQVLIGGEWVDVPPVPGALVVNIGDFLQLLSNDRFKSVEHRVLAMAAGPRISVGYFFRTLDGGRVYSPIVNSPAGDEHPRYKSVTVQEFIGYIMDKGLGGRSALDHFRL